MATPNYEIDYNNEQFKQVEADKQGALSEVKNTYGSMIEQSDSYFQSQNDAIQEWSEKQQQLQQENTDFTIEQIEQQKEQAHKDYLKEQSGAYADWQKQSNQYGANAEQMAISGLSNTGYSESSQVSMYNTYQNRVSTARENFGKAVQNYDNAIKDARLQNDSKLAEIAYNALQQQLEVSLQGFQYKNALVAEQLAQIQAAEDRYYGRYQDVLAQMNQQNALAEEVRQYNENLKYQKEQDALAQENWLKQYLYQQEQDKLAQENWQKEYELKQAQLEAATSTINELKIDEKNYDEENYGGVISTGAVPLSHGDVPRNSTGMSDAQVFGTFSKRNSGNGPTSFSFEGQPQGIVGYGRVTAAYDEKGKRDIYMVGDKPYYVWETPDGSKWYWDTKDRTYRYLQTD